MPALRKVAIFTLIGILILSLSSFANAKRELVREFDKKEIVSLKTVSGDCIIKTGETDKIIVKVINEYSPRDSFEPSFRERDNALLIKEKIYGSNRGSSTWIITVPEGTEIDFSTASGEMMVRDYTGALRGSTASGAYELINCKGLFDLKTASGSYDIKNCQGEFNIESASGNIYADGIIITEESDFTSASGNVKITLGATPKYDLNISTASGKAVLDYDGNKIVGFFEMTARYDKGRISAPFEFDDTEKFNRHGQRYIRNSITKKSDQPFITIATASGRATLRE